MKTFFRILFYIFIGLLLAVIAFPFVFKDRIIQEVKVLANNELNARVDFEDIDISLLRSFPQLDLKIINLNISGLDTFNQVELLSTKELRFNMSLEPFYNDKAEPEISFIGLKEPTINILILEDGTANYNITKTDSTESSYYVRLNSYSIEKGVLNYKDLSTNIQIGLTELAHEGKGDFTEIIFDLETESDFFVNEFTFDGFNYLSKLPVSMLAKLNVDLENNKYTLKENEIYIAKLKLLLDGYVRLTEEDIISDIKFNAPSNDFGQLLSALPYLKTDAKYKADGTFTLNGHVNGIYNGIKNLKPAFDINLKVVGGQASYEGLEFVLTDIQTNTKLKADKPDWSDLIVDVSNFNMKVNDETVKGAILINNAMENPRIKGEIIADINLENWKKAIPIDNIDLLKGHVLSDIKFNADMASVNNSDFEKINLAGNIIGENIQIKMSEIPLFTSNKLLLEASPAQVTISSLQSKLGASDFNLNGQLKDPLAIFSDVKDVSGNIKIESSLMDLNEWRGQTTESSDKTSVTASNSSVNNIEVDAKIDKLLYDQYVVNQLNIKGKIGSSAVDLNNLSFIIDESDIQINGLLLNPLAYFNGEAQLTGQLNLFSNKLNLNQFLSSEETSTEVLRLPTDIDLSMEAKINNLQYTNLDMKNARGTISVKDGVAKLENISSNIFDGSINLDALYDSNEELPEFDAKIEMNRIKFSDAYKNLETFRSIASIIEYIDGFFNSTLVFSGKLTDQMVPELTTLDATGYIETLDSRIKNLQIVEEIGEKLNNDKLKSLALENTKNWFEVKNGTVTFKDQDFKFNEINTTIGGSHRLNGEMSYQMLVEIPRTMLKNSKTTAIAESGLTYLEQQARKLGLNIQEGENINLKILIGQTLKNPSIKIIPLGTSGKSIKDDLEDKVSETVNKTKDSIKTVVNKKKEELIDTVKSKAQKEIDKAKDKAKDEANKVIDKAKSKADDKVKEVIDSTFTGGVTDSLKSKIDDLLNSKGTNADDLENVIKDWDIFKKKKKKKD